MLLEFLFNGLVCFAPIFINIQGFLLNAACANVHMHTLVTVHCFDDQILINVFMLKQS